MIDESPGNAGGTFPATRWSAIEAARSADPAERQRALDRFAALYWKPVYKYIRARWRRSGEDAQDLTQDFFATLIDRDTLAAFDPSRARLRTFVKSCVDALVAGADRDARRLKRGGGLAPLSLESELAEGELARTGLPAPERADALFEKEWTRSLFAAAVSGLRAACAERRRTIDFKIFERYDLNDDQDRHPTYAELSQEFGIKIADVTNHLAAARREFRKIVLALLRETTASEDEYRREARSLLGHAPE